MIYASVNDRTVPYVTAAIETFDPFMNHETNGIEMCVLVASPVYIGVIYIPTCSRLDEVYSPIIKSYSLPSHPPEPKPKPRILTMQWFKTLKPSRPFLPPAFQLRFPLNIVSGFYHLHKTSFSF
jgi:hypothetical protein